MPRLLQELPKEGHSYYLNVPTRMEGKPKSRRLRSVSKYGEVYEGKRPVGKPLKRKHTSDMLEYEVWCSVCYDAGCDRCPPFPESGPENAKP